MIQRFNSWAILPASMALWNKRRVTIADCATEWDSGTLLVCRNDQGRICFIHGAQGDYGVKVGDRHLTHHDQTLASKGMYEIVNIVHWKKASDKIDIKSVLPYDINTKASLAVFK